MYDMQFEFHTELPAQTARHDAYWRASSPLFSVREELHTQLRLTQARTHPHRRKTLFMPGMRQTFFTQVQPGPTLSNTHRNEGLRVPKMWEVLLSQQPPEGAPIDALQGGEDPLQRAEGHHQRANEYSRLLRRQFVELRRGRPHSE